MAPEPQSPAAVAAVQYSLTVSPLCYSGQGNGGGATNRTNITACCMSTQHKLVASNRVFNKHGERTATTAAAAAAIWLLPPCMLHLSRQRCTATWQLPSPSSFLTISLLSISSTQQPADLLCHCCHG
jgi:hypothetical protein